MRDGDKGTEINRIWKCTGHETEKGTQMQMQREGKQKEWDGLAIYVCGYLLRMARP